MSADGGAARRPFVADERGVSEVIGVVLIVAIVAILAGSVGAYVLGFGGAVRDPAPQFAPDVVYNDSYGGNGQEVRITHGSGNVIPAGRVEVTVTGARAVDEDSPASGVRAVYAAAVIEDQAGENFSATDGLVVNETAFDKPGGTPLGSDEAVDLHGATVRIVWSTPSDSRSAIIFEWRGPDA